VLPAPEFRFPSRGGQKSFLIQIQSLPGIENSGDGGIIHFREENGIQGDGLVMAAKEARTFELLNSPQAGSSPGRIPDDVSQADDPIDTKSADVGNNGIQRLKVRVVIADDGEGLLHVHAYCRRVRAST